MTTSSKPCCRSARSAHSGVKDFCSALSMQTPVKILVSGGVHRLAALMPNAEWAPLAQALTAYKCGRQTPGEQLAHVVNLAWIKLTATPDGQYKVVAKLPTLGTTGTTMLALKHALWSLVPLCDKCKGIGCDACSKTGLA